MALHQVTRDEIHPFLTSQSKSEHVESAELRRLETSLRIESFADHVDQIFQENISDLSDISSEDGELGKKSEGNNYIYNQYKRSFSPAEWKEESSSFFNFKSIGKERSWLKGILLSTVETGETNSDDDDRFDQEYLQEMLKRHVSQKKYAKQFQMDSLFYHENYFSYGSSLVLEHDKYHDKKKRRTGTEITRKKPIKFNKKKDKKLIEKDNKKLIEAKLIKQKLDYEKDMQYKRRKLWNFIVKKDIPKASRARANTRGTCMQTLKKVAQACQRERRKEALRSQKISKDALARARRMAREMLLYWRKFDKVEKEHRRKAEKEAIEQKRHDEEMREMKRQQRKLNFLITQTELYAHFMSKKMKGPSQEQETQNQILKQLEEPSHSVSAISVNGGYMVNSNVDDYDCNIIKKQAVQNVQNAISQQRKKVSAYDDNSKHTDMQQSFDGSFSLANPSLEEEKEHPQPRIFEGRLKPYQLKGMNWLISLYEKGINGILADEMGLGKTVQSIVFLGHLAEAYNIWGPFLVVAPASTLHNWQQEFTKFLPKFKVLPYWGDPNDRKSLRKYWNQRSAYSTDSEENAPFHVLITSYQLIVQDVKYFQRIRWQYIVLDEAHAIKSSQSLRWKVLLGYNCRNRLLLTGTPIQNTMAELWALLHFIMPTLFDSHEEFNEWFSKDIENHANEKKPNLDQNQLSRLHMILKPFMLRRVKKDVENELSEKIEIKVICDMSSRQKLFYQAVKNNIMFEDILQSATTTSVENKSTSILMNLVMQFRKVCNHPELFERKEPTRGLHFALPSSVMPKLLFDCYMQCSDVPLERLSSFEKLFQLWHPQYISQSLKEETRCFGFTRFIGLSPQQCYLLFTSLVERLRYALLILKELKKNEQQRRWKERKKRRSRYLTRNDLFIYQPPDLSPLNNRKEDSLCFTSYKTNISSFETCHISEVKTTANTTTNCLTKETEERHYEATFYPKYFRTYHQKVLAPPVQVYCSYRRAANYFEDQQNIPIYQILDSGNFSEVESTPSFNPVILQGLCDIRPVEGWSKIQLPDRSTLVSDSGKLTVLDQLLSRLKRNGHRVLIYSQMTKMIDIIEEFMNFRHHSYIRLDGSSKISDRRDMVANFQERDDIFAFLLSTRAGGLGINLTAADTVIFYDSDWNPTVDQQAMDRAHRLGQTKQVTVYRLVTRGTVEEKILNRAREKSEIQNIVISGGQFNKDVLRPKEVVSLLLDDAELDSKLKQRQMEKKQAVEGVKRSGRKRRNNHETQPLVNEKRVKNETPDEDGLSVTPSQEFISIDVDENSMSSIDLGSNLYEEDSSNTSRPPSTNPSSPSNIEQTKRQNSKGRTGGRAKAKIKGGTLAKAAASAAALAGAAAGSAAAYAAYGYSYQSGNNT